MAEKLGSIRAQIEKLQQRADSMRSAAIAQIHDIMRNHDLSAADIGEPAAKRAKVPRSAATSNRAKSLTKKPSKSKLPPKYRNSKTGETWSGMGRLPDWIKAAKDRTKFLIQPAADEGKSKTIARSSKTTTSTKKAVSKPAPKAAGKKIAAKYRDPETGATWAGRGLPPAWIASAKDRTPYLIQQAA